MDDPEQTPVDLSIPDEEVLKPKKAKKVKPDTEPQVDSEATVEDLRVKTLEGKLQELRDAANVILANYAKSHRMVSKDDFRYPGYKELYKVVNS